MGVSSGGEGMMRDELVLVGQMFSFGISVVLVSTFCFAVWNGGSVLVTVDSFGEMWWECGLLVVVVPLMVWGFVGTVKGFFQGLKV